MNVTPAILTDSFAVVQEQLAIASVAAVVSKVQVDVIDGLFSENTTVTPMDLTVGDFGDLRLDFHLMVEEPMDFVSEIMAVSDYLPVESVIAQVERMSFQEDFLIEVKKMSWLAGLALDLYTPLESIDDSSWSELDVLLLMGHEVGYQNVRFRPAAMENIEAAVKFRQSSGHHFKIIVDGGVRREHLRLLREMGIDEVAVGGDIWSSLDQVQTIEELVELASS